MKFAIVKETMFIIYKETKNDISER